MFKSLKICNSCFVPHYEDCPDCFGFGLIEINGKNIPLAASIAAKLIKNESHKSHKIISKCAKCNSSFKGIPKCLNP